MKAIKIIFFFNILIISNIYSQTHWVVFTDKNNVDFNPYTYFDQKAIERRLNIGYDLYNISDFPVNDKYIKNIKEIADSVSYTSRWLNAISIWTDIEGISKINKLNFVKDIISIESNMFLCNKLDDKNYDVDTLLWINQLKRMGGYLFKEAGIDGKGVRIAIFDGGFPSVDTHEAFEHIRKNNRIIKTHDFIQKKDNVYKNNVHGTMVLSNIAGIFDGKMMGLATASEFLLARTEKNTEPFSEEVCWVAALEWADKNGADIVNSSLGYTYHRYFPYQMDGKTTYISQIANTASSKGILVVNAAGNDGNNNWNRIGAPADADSILSVGGIDPDTDYKIIFSSVGPTSDMRPKPNVSAYGHTVVANKDGSIKQAFGTSFASPLVAGFVACTKQVFPNTNAMELKEIIEKSAHLYPYFDYAHGYGIPQASNILNNNKHDIKTTFDIELNKDSINIKIYEFISIDDLKKYENYLFYNIMNENNIIQEWGIINVDKQNIIFTKHISYDNASIVNLHLRGYTNSVKLNK